MGKNWFEYRIRERTEFVDKLKALEKPLGWKAGSVVRVTEEQYTKLMAARNVKA